MFAAGFRLQRADLTLPVVFPNRSGAGRAFLFCVCPIRSQRSNSHASSRPLPIRAQPGAAQPHPAVCLQNATDSSSNSSQKTAPSESSPLPWHKFMQGHRNPTHDLLDPYRLSEHYFLDQVKNQAIATPSQAGVLTEIPAFLAGGCKHMANGARLVLPSSYFFHHFTHLHSAHRCKHTA